MNATTQPDMAAVTQRDVAARSPLGQITRLKVPVTLLLAAGGFMALGVLLVGLAWVLLFGTSSFSTSENLLTAGYWLQVVATIGGLAAVCNLGWHVVLRQDLRNTVEVVAAAVSSLLVVIGFVVAASAASLDDTQAGWIIAAIGLGGLMLLALVNAGQRSILEQAAPVSRQSDLWLAAAFGLLALAVATALPAPTSQGRALPIAAKSVFVVGWLVLAVTVDIARERRFLGGHGTATLVAGLLVLAAGDLLGAVAYGFVFSSSSTLTTFRIGLSLPDFLQALGWAVIAFAAFQRLVGLKLDPGAGLGDSTRAQFGRGPTAAEPLASEPDQPTAAQRTAPQEHCGVALPPGSAFCPRCGQRVEQ